MKSLTRPERFGIFACLVWAVGVSLAAIWGFFDAHMSLASAALGYTYTEFDRFSLIRYLRAMILPILVYWILHLGVVWVRR